MSEKTLCQRNRDVILNRAKDYYKNDKNRLKEQERNKYRELSEEDKNIRRGFGRNRYLVRKETKIKKISKKLL